MVRGCFYFVDLGSGADSRCMRTVTGMRFTTTEGEDAKISLLLQNKECSRVLRLSIRGVASIAAAALLGSIISACSGGTAPPTIPQAHPSSPSASHVIAHFVISRAAASRIASKVKAAHAYASPIRGKQVVRIHTMSTAAGNDLAFNGGPVLTGAKMYNILVNSADESPWGGSIATFQNDLFASSMINILDQYINQSATGAFSYAGDVQVSYDTSSTLQDQDIYNIIYQVAQQYGTGYGNMYNVFLDSTVSQCSQNAGGCYAQQYCAYHGNTDYTDIGHAIYSVEPYQNINGCKAGASTPNGVLADSTASTLSHETFEAITDADVPQNVAWYNQSAGEIGDICAPAAGISTAVVNLNGDNWQIQSEYSNSVHDCSYTP